MTIKLRLRPMNAMLHPRDPNNEDIAALLGENVMDYARWVQSLLSAMREYCVALNTRWIEVGAIAFE